MEELVVWVKNIAIFYIIAALIIQVIPGKKYIQYIKAFLGILTIILLIRPIGDLFSLEDKLVENLQSKLNIQMEDELKRDLELVGQYQQDAIVGEYLTEMENQIKEYVEGQGVIYNGCDVNLNLDENLEAFGTVEGISLDIAIEPIEGENYVDKKGFYEIEIKKYLANFYNLSERNININISEVTYYGL